MSCTLSMDLPGVFLLGQIHFVLLPMRRMPEQGYIAMCPTAKFTVAGLKVTIK